jgi:hypothetical protein
MKITFDVGGHPAEFHRNAFTGRTYVIVDGHEHVLAKLSQASTHFSYDPARSWNISHAGHGIAIDWQRSQFLGGLRPQSFTIRVDGQQVASARGR